MEGRCFMKSMCKALWQYIEGINGVILIIYSLLVSITHIFISTESTKYFLRWSFISMLLCIILCPILMKWSRKMSINTVYASHNAKDSVKWKLLLFAIPFVVFLIRFIACYPGGLTYDSLAQYEQAIENNYNDWHPVIHTLLAFKLPLALTGGWTGSIVLFQITLFSFVVAYALFSIKQHTNPSYVIMALFFIILNPRTLNMAVSPWKDVWFALGALLLITYALHIYYTKGEWLKSPTHTVIFILTVVLTTLLRHNALLFTIPLLFAIALIIKPKKTLVICLSTVALLFAVKYPLYSLLDVENPDKRQAEMLGLPMVIIGAAVTNAPETLDEEILEFAYKVSPQEVWENKYTYGSFNDVKWDERTNNDVIEEYGTIKILSMTADCIKNCPNESIRGLIKLTNPVYTITDDYNVIFTPTIPENEYNIEHHGIPKLDSLIKKATVALNILFPHIFLYLGAMHLTLLVLMMAKYKLNKWKDWKKIFFILPVFVYNFGTTFLLTGAQDAFRFFYYTFLIMPVLLVFLCRNEQERGMEFSVCER